MGVSLSKGGNVSLTKAAPNLTAVAVGLGWDLRTTTGTDFDLDASAIALTPDKKVVSDGHFVFFNNLKSPEGSIEHAGDNRTGEGEGDDEVINIDLANTPPTIDSIVFPVSIYEAEPAARASARSATPTSASSTAPTAPSWLATTSPRTPPPRPPWSSVSCTATVPSGSSAPPARATPPA